MSGLLDTIRQMVAGADARALVVKVGAAIAIIGAITLVADWRLNGRLDRSGLERLAAGSAADGAVGRKTPRR